MKRIVSFITLIILFSSCEPNDRDDCHYKIRIKNNSDKVLYLYSASEPKITPGDIRNDPYFETVPAHAGNGKVEFGNIRYIGGSKPQCVESFYEPEEEFYIYVFDSLAISKKSWEEVIEKNLYVKRFDITVNKLRENGFILEYNPE